MSKYTTTFWMRDGLTVYSLDIDGHKKGIGAFRNRFSALVQGGPGTPIEELEGIARLMAAAPMLLVTLQRLVESVDPESTGWGEAVDAIVLATGEAP